MQTKVLNIRGFFRNCLQTQGKCLGIVELIIMSPVKFYYDPKHPAGFDSLAKLVNVFKNEKQDV